MEDTSQPRPKHTTILRLGQTAPVTISSSRHGHLGSESQNHPVAFGNAETNPDDFVDMDEEPWAEDEEPWTEEEDRAIDELVQRMLAEDPWYQAMQAQKEGMREREEKQKATMAAVGVLLDEVRTKQKELTVEQDDLRRMARQAYTRAERVPGELDRLRFMVAEKSAKMERQRQRDSKG